MTVIVIVIVKVEVEVEVEVEVDVINDGFVLVVAVVLDNVVVSRVQFNLRLS